MKYIHKKIVSPCDLDEKSRPFPSFYLRCMQEAAHLHMTAYPPSPETLRDEYGRVFILSRAAVSVLRELSPCEEIEISTWASPAHGFTFPRNVEIKSGGETVARVASVWALLDIENKTLCRPDGYPCSYTTEAPLETNMPLRFRIPRDAELELIGEYGPKYFDIDLNGHVNNTRYPDIFLSFIPDGGFKLTDMGISYLHEAKPGDTMKIYLAVTDEAVYMRSVLPDGETNAEFVLKRDNV